MQITEALLFKLEETTRKSNLMELFRMGDKVEQTAEAKDESTINQAGRDINNHYGPKMYEIIQTIDYQVSHQFESLLHKHAPVLIKNEMLKVEEAVNNFKETISSRLSEQFEILKTSLSEDVAGEKLIKGVTDSDFQYLFQDSLEQVIRKKELAPQEVLVELLISKAKSEDNSDYLIQEAIEVLKYLNKNHTNFILLFSYLLHNLSIRYDTVNTNVDEETINNLKLSILFQIKWTLYYFLELNLSKIDFEYLSYKGLIVETKFYTEFDSIIDNIVSRCIPEKVKNQLNISNSEIVEIFLPELFVIFKKIEFETPYNFKVLSKISNVIAEKSRGNLIMSIERFKDLNKTEWTEKLYTLQAELQRRGVSSLS